MNLILFSPQEWGRPLDVRDVRGLHIQEILKLAPGDPVRLGMIGESWGVGTYQGKTDGSHFFQWPERTEEGLKPYPLTILLGTPRPPTARRLLKDLTTLGAARLWFTASTLGEKSYLQSSLWTKQEYTESLIEGAQQGQTTLLPEVKTFWSLKKALEALGDEAGLRWAPELPKNGSRGEPWPLLPPEKAVVALGPERGWTTPERDQLIDAGFLLSPLGPRNLRTETAATAAATLVLARYWWNLP